MNIYEVLNNLNIKYDEIRHEAVYTIEQAKNLKVEIEGIGCKNLFLTDKKGKYYLVILDDSKRANIKEVSKVIGVSHLSFASNEELNSILKLEAGSVTPLGIINDYDNKVLIIIDKDLKDNKLLFHPSTNTRTISISFEDLIKFIEYEKHSYSLM